MDESDQKGGGKKITLILPDKFPGFGKELVNWEWGVVLRYKSGQRRKIVQWGCVKREHEKKTIPYPTYLQPNTTPEDIFVTAQFTVSDEKEQCICIVTMAEQRIKCVIKWWPWLCLRVRRLCRNDR
jgi:hypothetical protein